MKMLLIVLGSIISWAAAVPVSQLDSNRRLAKRGLFDRITHFPFLASSSSAHGSSSSSSSSSSSDNHDYDHEYGIHDFHHDSIPDFHSVSHTSHVIHHPELNHHDFSYNIGHDDVAISYQNQHFEHKEYPISYQNQHLFDNHLPAHDDHYDSKLNKFDGLYDSLLDNSHLDAPEYSHGYIGDYKNYGGDLGQYSEHAGLLDISDDHKIDHLLDAYSPSHSSYDSY